MGSTPHVSATKKMSFINLCSFNTWPYWKLLNKWNCIEDIVCSQPTSMDTEILCVVNSLIHFCTERKCLLCLYPALACLQLLLAAISLWMYYAWILVAVHLAYMGWGGWNTKITWAQFSPLKAFASPVYQLIWCKDLWLTGSSVLLHAGRHYSYLYVTLTRVNFVFGVVAA